MSPLDGVVGRFGFGVRDSGRLRPAGARREETSARVRSLDATQTSLAVLLDDGSIVAKTNDGMRASIESVDAAPGREQLRHDGRVIAFLERGRPFLWQVAKKMGPRPLCDLQEVRHVFVGMSRACIVSASGALACTDVEAPDCAAITKGAAARGTVVRVVPGVGGPAAFDASGTGSLVAFRNGEPHLDRVTGARTASEFLGTISKFTSRGHGSYTGARSEICLRTGDTNRCFDVKTGRARPAPQAPEDATNVRVVGRDTVCFVRSGAVGCAALDVGLADGDPAFVGRALEQIPPLPQGETASDFDGFESGDEVGMYALTTRGEVWSWQSGPRRPAPEWQRVDLEIR